jgi:hypothetical protein
VDAACDEAGGDGAPTPRQAVMARGPSYRSPAAALAAVAGEA